MKKALFTGYIALALNPSIHARAVSDFYSFSYGSSQYEFLKGPIIRLHYAWGAGDTYSRIYPGFSLPSMQGSHDVEVRTNGSFSLIYNTDPHDYEEQDYITDLMGGLCDRGIYIPSAPSEIVYQVDTTMPANRILKIEFRNMGFKRGSAFNSMNFQVWLYQKGHIEYRFGLQNITGIKGSYKIGIFLESGGKSYYYLAGHPQWPYAVIYEGYSMDANLSNQDIKYRFEWKKNTVSGVKNISDRLFEMFPVPAHENLEVDAGKELIEKLELSDISGRIFNVPINYKTIRQASLDLSAVPAGAYILSLYCGDAILRRKFIKLQ